MKKTKWLIGTFIISISMLLAPMAHADFSDVPDDHKFKNYIDHLVELDAIGGYPDGTFRAESNVTRGQAAKILAVALKMPLINPATPTFKDVPKTNGFYTYIETLAAKGIIAGNPDGTFKSQNSLTRAQVAAIIANSFDLAERSYVEFKDVDRNQWYYLNIDKLATSEITVGYPGNLFKPSGIVTRGEIAAFISRGINGYDTSKYEYRNVFLNMSKAQVRVIEGIPSLENEKYLVYNSVKGNPLNAKITYTFFYGELDIMEFDFDLSHIPATEAATEAFFNDIVNKTFKPQFGDVTSNEKYEWMHSDFTKDSLYAFWFTPTGNRIELVLQVKSVEKGPEMILRVVR
ncbi:S-layer homology domain-containing protein [Sporosarcina siberiensis]|uniref:S-layer homology domain-containing protein n=1 Tax=Sporosarcina siberiensis TaxID=1365606 RepID=A0ABW4SLC8_9BACL